MMTKIILLGLLISFVNIHGQEIHINNDVNSSIERLDIEYWDDTYYQYKLVNNIPFQYNKQKNNYHFNPIYVTYFLKNYRVLYEKTKKIKYINYAKIILEASMIKSENISYEGVNSIIFPYEANRFVSRMFHKHYSGLTQGYFLKESAKLYELTGEEYFKDIAIKFYNSLVIPINKGGVMYHYDKYYAIAEVPTVPHGWILNGWLSSISSMITANEILKNKEISIFIKKNIYTLEHVIEKFDVSALKNSRYNLTQFFYFKLLVKEYKIKSIKFEYQYEDPVYIKPSIKYIDNSTKFNKFSRWEFFVAMKHDLKFDNKIFYGHKYILFNGVLSSVSEYNRIVIDFENKINSVNEVDFLIYTGSYDPLKSSPTNLEWVNIAKQNMILKNNKLIINIINKELNHIVGYPTNFIKKLKNGRYNAYHDIHINRLYDLGKKFKSKKLLYFANKFFDYRQQWDHTDIYQQLFKNNKVILNDISQ